MNDERLFVAVVRTGGFSAAARYAGTTQSRVSRAVQRLETRLGVALLRRSSRQVQPTATGRAYAQALAKLLADKDALDARVRDREGLHGPLRITAPPALTRRVLAPSLVAFCGAHPGVRLELDLSARRADLIDEGFDLAVRFGPLAETWRRATRIRTGHYRVYAPPAYASANITEAGLGEVPTLVLRVTHLRDRWPVRGKAGLTWLRVTPTHLVDDVEVIVQLACEGLGVAILPDLLVTEEVAAGKLVPLSPEGVRAEVYALTEAQRSPLAQALIPFLRGGRATATERPGR